jgi:ADP-ribosylglycohydrolase
MEKPGLGRYRGCLLGGAIGDALGAPIEFMSLPQIRQHFGAAGLQSYPDDAGGLGRFTDDTQMTLFTAEGLLRAQHRAMLKGIAGARCAIVYQSYLRWLYTQGLRPETIPAGHGVYDVEKGWLINQASLHRRRAPGRTCLCALQSGTCGSIQMPVNDSKGCGGIMRMAPVGLMYYYNLEAAFNIGCELAAITHGHPTGYLATGCFSAIIAGLAQGKDLPSAIHATIPLLTSHAGYQECLQAIDNALAYVDTHSPTPKNIEALGAGWVAEEALAISLFCSLHYQDDFKAGVLAAINHGGDSDSTGAITGNILGLVLGVQAIPPEWIENLEMVEIVEQIAQDMCTEVKGDSLNEDAEWCEKYPPY